MVFTHHINYFNKFSNDFQSICGLHKIGQKCNIIDLCYNDIKCRKILVASNMIGSTFFQSQSNLV